MTIPQKKNETTETTFAQIFRLIFVIFLLYLLGDAFYRWDGFSKYASFADFIPGVALVSILWSIVALSCSLLIWLLLFLIQRLSMRSGFKLSMAQLLFLTGIFVVNIMVVWKIKTLLWPQTHTSYTAKLIVLLCIIMMSIPPAWMLRKKAAPWMSIIQERITPLLWLFSTIVILSVPFVAYHTWGKGDAKISQAADQPDITEENRPNIILVIFDTLASRNMSLYGYNRPTTPFISKWAEKASVFTRLQAASNYTTPTTASFMTGKRVWTHRTFHISGSSPISSDTESLPAVLKNNGYFNLAFVVNPVASVNALNISKSFDIAPAPVEFSNPSSLKGIIFKNLFKLFGDKIKFHDWILKSDFIFMKPLNMLSSDFSETEVPPSKAFNTFLKILDRDIPEPYFAWIHVYPPHDPYLPPADYRAFFNPSKELRTHETQGEIFLESFKLFNRNKSYPKEMRRKAKLLKDYYDEFILYSDNQFAEFISRLEKGNKLTNTIVILSSDHGESFEHDYLGHGGPFLFEQVTHIPLIIKEPDQEEGQVIHNLSEQVDLPATILDLAGLYVPRWMEGRSLLPLLRGQQLGSAPAFSMNLDHNSSLGKESLITKGTIAVWEGDYKLIHYLDRGQSLLFNLKEDPGELNNLFDNETGIAGDLLGIINKNLKKANEKIRNEN